MPEGHLPLPDIALEAALDINPEQEVVEHVLNLLGSRILSQTVGDRSVGNRSGES